MFGELRLRLLLLAVQRDGEGRAAGEGGRLLRRPPRVKLHLVAGDACRLLRARLSASA
jgi:hypothetical protein